MQEILDNINQLKLQMAELMQIQDQIIENLDRHKTVKNLILLKSVTEKIDQITEKIDYIDTLIQAEMPIDEIYDETDETDENDIFLDYYLPKKKLATC